MSSESESMRRVVKARSQLVVAHAFFGVLSLYLKLETDNGSDNPTMSTDGIALFINDAFVESLSDAELRGVVAHEVWHCGCLHMDRRGTRPMDDWNRACDYAINDDLIELGFTLPSGALINPKFRGFGAEAIFGELQREKQQQVRQGTLQAGSGAGNDPGRCGGILDRPSAAPDTADAWQGRTLQAAAIAKAQAGKLPGSIQRLVDSLRASQVNWKDILRRFADQSAIKAASWSRPNRRFIAQGLYLPGKVSDAAMRMLVGIDTSGSIDADALRAFASELQELLDAQVCDRISVAYCDTEISSIVEFETGDSVTLNVQGGGGTSFVPVMEWAEQQTDAACVIYFTDTYGTFGPEPALPVLWATWIQNPRVPFGEVVQIDAYS